MLEHSSPIHLCFEMKSGPKLQKIKHPAVGMLLCFRYHSVGILQGSALETERGSMTSHSY